MTDWIGFYNVKEWFINEKQFLFVKWICMEFNASEVRAKERSK